MSGSARGVQQPSQELLRTWLLPPHPLVVVFAVEKRIHAQFWCGPPTILGVQRTLKHFGDQCPAALRFRARPLIAIHLHFGRASSMSPAHTREPQLPSAYRTQQILRRYFASDLNSIQARPVSNFGEIRTVGRVTRFYAPPASQGSISSCCAMSASPCAMDTNWSPVSIFSPPKRASKLSRRAGT